MKVVKMFAHILVLVGALNWGLAVLGFNLVYLVLGGMPAVEQVVYILVGLSAVYLLVTTSEWRGGGSSSGGSMM